MITPPSANSPRYSSHLLHQRRWRASAFINSVTSITHKNPNGTQIVQHSYTYDETNNIVEYLNSIDGQTSYDYDFLGQLISADHANQTDESYIYDSNGNRITANGSNYTTGDNNELTSDGDYTYTYDTEGNRISKTNTSGTERELYTWDYRNRLTSVTKQTYNNSTNEWTTVQIVEYAYDYNNIWIRKTVGDSKTIFIPENYQTAVQIDNGTVSHHYLWTPNQQDKLLADTTNNGVLWSLTDHLGTVRDILGSEDAHLIYDAFGNLLSGTNPLLFGYTGKAFDNDTHLQNNINRWYDAAIGRWLSTDPIGFSGNDTNLYRYVRNCLISTLDCSGLWEKSWLSFLPPRKSPKECGIILYLGHGTTFGGKNDVLPIGKNRIIVPHDIGQFQQDLNSMDPSLLEAPNLFFGFLGCWANKFNVGGDILAFPKNHRIEVGGQPLDFGEIGNKMVNKIGMIKEMEMTIPTIYAFAQQLKRSGRCCSVTVFMVGNYETYLMFHRQTLKVNGQKVTLLMLTPVRI